MPLIGITGGIACGKSAVTRLLAAQGAVAFSADEAARAVLSPGGKALLRIAEEFGEEMLTPGGQLDRARMGRLAFADKAARSKLERILHPLIRSLLWAQIEAVREDFPPQTVLVVEIPLLYEGGLETWFDAVVVVSASEAVQLRRLWERDGLPAAEAHRRLDAQQKLEIKIVRAEIVLSNDGTEQELSAKVQNLWMDLMCGISDPRLKKTQSEPNLMPSDDTSECVE